MNRKTNKTQAGRSRTRSWWRIIGFALLGVVLASAILIYGAWRRIPPGLQRDFRAGIAARDVVGAEQRLAVYLENRYGPQDDAANREAVFLDFFNVEHIKALQIMVHHTPEAQKEANIRAMADWVANYRNTLTPKERARLQRRFSGEEGRAILRQATAQYNQQDVHYRGQTASVISELLKTIYSLEHP